MQTSLLLTKQHLDEMIRHVSEQTPLEACGLLAGDAGRVEAVLAMANAAQSHARFRIDPQEQLRAFEWIDARGLDLVGIFHSHPVGPAMVSAIDIAEATYPVIHIVLSPFGDRWQARGFWIEDGRAQEVTLKVE